MGALTAFLIGTAFAAHGLARRAARGVREPLTALEQGIVTAVFGVGLWLAQGWTLASVGLFRWEALLATGMLCGLLALLGPRGGVAHVSPHASPARGPGRRDIPASIWIPSAIVAAWILYSAAALWVLPVSNHDALSYHFPKAVWLAKTGALALYPSQDLRVTYSPGNYELLSATFMMFLGSDRATGFITTGALALLLATSFAWIRRTWGSPAAWLTLPLLLASPVVLLHATAHKNDLLMAAFTVNALVWLGRFAAGGGRAAGAIGVVALGIAVSTKFHGLFVAAACTILLWRAWRSGAWRPAPAVLAVQGAAAIAALLLLGGVQYVLNVIHTGHLTGIIQSPTPNAMNTVDFPAWGQVPRFVWMLLTAPLFTEGQYFTVPWTGESWFWPAYELYFSHYGLHVTVLVLLLPWGIRFARQRLDHDRLRELSGISLAALVLVALNALIGLQPYGGFAFIPRFLFFALPLLLIWTWAGWAAAAASPRRRAAALAFAVIIAAGYSIITVVRDRFTPAEYVELLWNHPDQRRVIFQANWRAALYADREAAPDATVAVDAGYDGWTYPLFGQKLSRRVEVILPAEGPYVPAAGVDWVVIDRGFSIVWGHPELTDMSRARRFIDRGPVPEPERRVFESLMQNPEFERVYWYPARFQAVFRRIAAAPSAANRRSGS